MSEENQQELQSLQKELTQAQSAYSNMMGFEAWDWSAYKVEAHEKDAVINALGYYLQYLRRREEELLDATELCK